MFTPSYNNALPQSIGPRTANKDVHTIGITPPRQVEVSLGLDGVGSAGRYMKLSDYITMQLQGGKMESYTFKPEYSYKYITSIFLYILTIIGIVIFACVTRATMSIETQVIFIVAICGGVYTLWINISRCLFKGIFFSDSIVVRRYIFKDIILNYSDVEYIQNTYIKTRKLNIPLIYMINNWELINIIEEKNKQGLIDFKEPDSRMVAIGNAIEKYNVYGLFTLIILLFIYKFVYIYIPYKFSVYMLVLGWMVFFGLGSVVLKKVLLNKNGKRG